MNKIKRLQILLLKERLEKLTGKRVCLKESKEQELYNIIKQNQVDENGSWVVNTPDFELKYDDKGDFMFSWINTKTSKYKGLDIFKALVLIAQKEGNKEINALAAKGKTNGITANGFYSLVKWGFESTKGIDWVNKLLGTKYQSYEEARKDPNFLPMWKEKGQESYVTFDTTPNSLSMRTLNSLSTLKEEISAKEAYNNLGSIQTIISGRRNIGWITFPKKQELSLIRGSGLETLPVPLNPNSYIIYRQGFEKEAEELLNIANKYQGRLSVNASEEDSRRIGQLLGYKQSDIEDYILHNKQFRS